MVYLSRFRTFPLICILLGLCIAMPMSNGLAIDNSTAVKDDIETGKNDTDDTETKTLKNRECLLVEACEYYAWFINDGDYGIPGFPKETVEKSLRKAECGLDEDGNVVKGEIAIWHYWAYIKCNKVL